MLIELDRLLKQAGNLPFSLLPPHHDIILVMRQIPLLINQSAQPTLLRSVVEKVVFQLYQSTTGLSIEVYCRFLQTLIELSCNISKETLSWILYSDDEVTLKFLYTLNNLISIYNRENIMYGLLLLLLNLV